MNKRVVFLLATFLLASFLQACTTTGHVINGNSESYSHSTAIERAR